MKNAQDRFQSLQARARAAADRSTQNRVVVNRAAVPESPDTDETASTPVSAELWLYGTVGGYWWGFDSDDVAAALRALGDVDEILVRLHSFGGNAIEGIAIANLLANHHANVRVVVDGLAASAASMIALAGSELIMSPGSQLMVHDAWSYSVGNAGELREAADFLDKQSQNYAETYAHRAGGTAASWREVMLANNGAGTWYSAQEAVDAGLAARVENIASTTTPPPMPDPTLEVDDIELAAAAEWDLEVLIHPAARAAWNSWRQPGAPKPPTASAGGSSTNPEGATLVDLTDEQIATLRQQVGFPENADAETIVAALAEALEERAEPTAPTNTTVPSGSVIIEQAVLDGLRSDARDGAEARRVQRDQERDTAIEAAIADGRTTPARREHWQAAWKADAEGARAQLASLTPGLVPVAEAGHDQSTDAGGVYAELYGHETTKGA